MTLSQYYGDVYRDDCSKLLMAGTTAKRTHKSEFELGAHAAPESAAVRKMVSELMIPTP